jgi:hypothetical protein
MTTSSTTQVDQISFQPAIKAIVTVVGVIGIAIIVALFFNSQRKAAIISEYDHETTQLITSKPELVKKLFTETFAQCQQLMLEKQASESGTYKSQDIMCKPGQEVLSELGVDTLKNSSAVAYVHYNNGSYSLLEASGKYNELRSLSDNNSFNHFGYKQELRQNINNYFATGTDIDRWQDFISYIDGKEVLVPVMIDNQNIGYIFRGVIER